MKAFLMYRDRDFDLQQELPWNAQDLIQDLELTTLFNAMARDDELLYDVAKQAILSSVDNPSTIIYRQNILKDCLNHPAIIEAIYDIAVEAIERERKVYWGILSRSPSTILHRSVEVLQMFVGMLKKLQTIADENADKFESEGFKRFFAMLNAELSDEYFAIVQYHLGELEFRHGVLVSAELGQGNKGVNYVLRKLPEDQRGWLQRIFGKQPASYSFQIADRDQNGMKALSELKDRGLSLVANALAQSTDHILSFFAMVRTELAFYMGCLNLHEQLVQLQEPMCFPQPTPPCEPRHSFAGLYDVCLALSMQQKVVSNSVTADDTHLVIITGANQGGKSTFLRSIGLAQIMMQCGMFVPAESLCASVCDGVFTHYKREEDTTMESGKLDEELSRMSDIVDSVRPNSIVLFNESFAATNEREGSAIAEQIVSALLEAHIRVFFVTHLYGFAHSFYNKEMENALYLLAERQPDGSRTFKLNKGEPRQTSYGVDLYKGIFA